MTFNFYHVIYIITIVQLTIFTCYLLSSGNRKRPGNQLLAAFLFVQAILTFGVLINSQGISMLTRYPHFLQVAVPFLFLPGPLLFLYTNAIVYRGFTLKRKHLLHMLPAVVHLLYLMSTFYFYSADEKRAMLLSGTFHGYFYSIAVNSLIYLIIFLYLVASLRLLRIYHSEIKNQHSNIDLINLSWLRIVLYGYFAMFILWFSYMFVLLITGKGLFFLLFGGMLLLFLFANVILFRGLRQPKSFEGIDEQKKARQPILSQSDKTSYMEKLKTFVEQEKPYLIPTLSMSDLADKIAIPTRYLSNVINDSFKQNFYDFINSYRIEEAKLMFKDPANEGKTVLEILYESGFNSKSTFNYAFKKHTGMSPTEFVKTHRT